MNIHFRDWDSLDSLSFIGLVCLLFLEVSENIVEYKITVGLFGEEECLSEFSPCLTSIRHLSNNENDDTSSGGRLRVDGVNVDFTVFVTDRLDSVVNFLDVSTSCDYALARNGL